MNTEILKAGYPHRVRWLRNHIQHCRGRHPNDPWGCPEFDDMSDEEIEEMLQTEAEDAYDPDDDVCPEGYQGR